MTGQSHAPDRPLYARALRLRHLSPDGLLCFLFFEAMVVLGTLLALAELVPWWGVLVLPGAVAVMVKINDVIAGSVSRAAPEPVSRATRPTSGARPGRLPAVGDERSPEPAEPRRYASSSTADIVFSPVGGGGVPRPVGSGRGGRVAPSQPGPRLGAPAESLRTLGAVHSVNAVQPGEATDSPSQRAQQSATRRYR